MKKNLSKAKAETELQNLLIKFEGGHLLITQSMSLLGKCIWMDYYGGDPKFLATFLEIHFKQLNTVGVVLFNNPLKSTEETIRALHKCTDNLPLNKIDPIKKPGGPYLGSENTEYQPNQRVDFANLLLRIAILYDREYSKEYRKSLVAIRETRKEYFRFFDTIETAISDLDKYLSIVSVERKNRQLVHVVFQGIQGFKGWKDSVMEESRDWKGKYVGRIDDTLKRFRNSYRNEGYLVREDAEALAEKVHAICSTEGGGIDNAKRNALLVKLSNLMVASMSDYQPDSEIVTSEEHIGKDYRQRHREARDWLRKSLAHYGGDA